MAFPTNPIDGQTYKNYIYNSTNEAWSLNIKLDLDDWHYIGDPGEPAFENGWLDYGQAWGRSRFRKSSDGLVTMEGLVRGGTPGVAIFHLPVGYRPTIPNDHGLHFPGANSDFPNKGALLYIENDGSVHTAAQDGSTWASISVSFSTRE